MLPHHEQPPVQQQTVDDAPADDGAPRAIEPEHSSLTFPDVPRSLRAAAFEPSQQQPAGQQAGSIPVQHQPVAQVQQPVHAPDSMPQPTGAPQRPAPQYSSSGPIGGGGPAMAPAHDVTDPLEQLATTMQPAGGDEPPAAPDMPMPDAPTVEDRIGDVVRHTSPFHESSTTELSGDLADEEGIIGVLSLRDTAREALRARLMRAAQLRERRPAFEIVFIFLAFAAMVLLVAPPLIDIIEAIKGEGAGAS